MDNLENHQEMLSMIQKGITWKEIERSLELLKQARTTSEYAMLFDINGFMYDDSIPDVFKRLRRKIG